MGSMIVITGAVVVGFILGKILGPFVRKHNL